MLVGYKEEVEDVLRAEVVGGGEEDVGVGGSVWGVWV